MNILQQEGKQLTRPDTRQDSRSSEIWRTDGPTDIPTDRHGKVYSRVSANEKILYPQSKEKPYITET